MEQQIVEVASVGAVISLTAVVLQGLKAWFSTIPGLSKLPMIVLAIVVAMGLTLLAKAAGYLQGSTGVLLAQTVLAALGSSGLYSAMSGSATQSLRDVGSGKQPPDLLPLLFLCACLAAAGTPNTGCATLKQIVAPSTQPVTSSQRLAKAQGDYLSVLQFFTFLRDQHVVSQRWINEQQPMFDAAQSALKIWELALKAKDTETANTAEQKFLDAANVLRILREQYEHGPTTQPAVKVDEYDSRGNARASTTPLGDWCPRCG